MTIAVDERVLRAVRVKAARTGRRDSEMIDEALRRDLGLDLLDRVWESADLPEEEALQLGVEAQHERAARSACGPSSTSTSSPPL